MSYNAKRHHLLDLPDILVVLQILWLYQVLVQLRKKQLHRHNMENKLPLCLFLLSAWAYFHQGQVYKYIFIFPWSNFLCFFYKKNPLIIWLGPVQGGSDIVLESLAERKVAQQALEFLQQPNESPSAPPTWYVARNEHMLTHNSSIIGV